MLLIWISPHHALRMVINCFAHPSFDCHVVLQAHTVFGIARPDTSSTLSLNARVHDRQINYEATHFASLAPLACADSEN